ncbi:TolC family protein [Entomohabitans teleogrylli]|uniref:TolC family protein n=1 Tax=Entomohabitans teleogrylli TaxID=1384589 RepID=UPI0008FC91F5|nr:efflux transporter outer membrane subunit [Entomohabitans teleogrylli]
MAISRLFLTCGLLCLSGCGNVLKSHYTAPPVRYPEYWRALPAVNMTSNVPFRWRDFADPDLENWLRQVLSRNNSVALAILRLQRARLDVRRTDINRFPETSLNLSNSSRRNLDSASSLEHSSAAQFNVRYEVDLWGKQARQRDAARLIREATAADLAAAKLTLITEASKNYWRLAFLHQRLAASQQSLEWAQKGLQLVRTRYMAGHVSGLDLIEAEQNVITRQNHRETLQQQLIEAKNAQSLLLGAPPGTVLAEPHKLPAGPFPEINPGIPALVLAQRSDLAASELRLREALSQVDIRRAQYYPSFSLTGNFGASSNALLEFIRNPLVTFGTGLALPFIQWRQMDVDVALARNDYQQRRQAFIQTLYKAMVDVENSLAKRRQLQNEERRLRQSLALAAISQTLNEVRYREGATPINFWLDAQEKHRQARLALDTNRYEQLQNLAQLYLAFGGNSQDIQAIDLQWRSATPGPRNGSAPQ